MKIKDMTLEEKREYHKGKSRLWRLNNPEKLKAGRKAYKSSEKGKTANSNYQRKNYAKHNKKYRNRRNISARERYKDKIHKQQSKEYINNYLKSYMLNQENHKKYLIRQKDYQIRNKLLKQQSFCSLCGSNENLEMHHKKYDESSDIIILCRTCHRGLHRKDNLNQGGI